jgi:hypothetical protein
MFYFLDTSSQIKRISKNVNLFENDERSRMSENTEILRDITDGLLYKKILNSEVGNLIKKKEAFTLTLNTDGISLSENSTLSMWPVYTVINEIKAGERFCFENVIIVGKLEFKFKFEYKTNNLV